jgi:hypothetical protein
MIKIAYLLIIIYFVILVNMTTFIEVFDKILPMLNPKELAVLYQVSSEAHKKVNQSKSLKKSLWRADLLSPHRKSFWTTQINLSQ